jgi:hypothetical protein
VKRFVRKEPANKIKTPASQLEWGRKGESWAPGSCGPDRRHLRSRFRREMCITEQSAIPKFQLNQDIVLKIYTSVFFVDS